MKPDQDRGTGDDADHFPASDLEQLYKLGATDPSWRIRGDALNLMRHTNKYLPDAWYVLDERRGTVQRL